MHRNCFQHEIWDISLDSFKEEIDPLTIGGIDGLFVRYQVTSKQLILSASCITPEISSIKSTQTSSTTLGIVTQYSTSIQDCTHLVFYRYNQSGVSFHKVFVFKQCEFIAFHPRYNIQNEMIFVLIVHNVRDQNIECSVFSSDGDEIYVSSVCDSCQYYGMILDSRYDDDSSTMVDHFFNRLLPNSNELYLPKITGVLYRNENKYHALLIQSTCKPLVIIQTLVHDLLPQILFSQHIDPVMQQHYHEISQTIPLPPLILPLNEEFISRVLSLLFDFNHFVNSILERQYTTFFNNNVYPTLKNDLSIVSSDNFIIMKTKVELCFKFFKLIHNPLETKLELHSQCLNFASLLFPFFKILSYSLQDRVNPVMINAILKRTHTIQYFFSFSNLLLYCLSRPIDIDIKVYLRYMFEVYNIGSCFDDKFFQFTQTFFGFDVDFIAQLVFNYDMDDPVAFQEVIKEFPPEFLTNFGKEGFINFYQIHIMIGIHCIYKEIPHSLIMKNI
ncbi:hypothetical protein QTN25_003426 [Entamoeba marina]